jgi:hypothetical protein
VHGFRAVDHQRRRAGDELRDDPIPWSASSTRTAALKCTLYYQLDKPDLTDLILESTCKVSVDLFGYAMHHLFKLASLLDGPNIATFG